MIYEADCCSKSHPATTMVCESSVAYLSTVYRSEVTKAPDAFSGLTVRLPCLERHAYVKSRTSPWTFPRNILGVTLSAVYRNLLVIVTKPCVSQGDSALVFMGNNM